MELDSNIIESFQAKGNEIGIKYDSLMINGEPCRVVKCVKKQLKNSILKSIEITGINYWNELEMKMIIVENDEVTVPVFKKHSYFLINVDEQTKVLTLMDVKGNTRADIKLCYATEKDKKISNYLIESKNKNCELIVTVMFCMNYEKVINHMIVNKLK
jgi:hypothetical protein